MRIREFVGHVICEVVGHVIAVVAIFGAAYGLMVFGYGMGW